MIHPGVIALYRQRWNKINDPILDLTDEDIVNLLQNARKRAAQPMAQLRNFTEMFDGRLPEVKLADQIIADKAAIWMARDDFGSNPDG